MNLPVLNNCFPIFLRLQPSINMKLMNGSSFKDGVNVYMTKKYVFVSKIQDLTSMNSINMELKL